jgi:hypothetical protein
MWVHNSDKTTTNQGLSPSAKLTRQILYLFPMIVDTQQMILGITTKTQKKSPKIVKNMMLLGACIMCKVKPKGAGFTGMKALQGRAKRGPESG